MAKKEKKNTFIICGKDFFKAKPEGNAIASQISTAFNAGFTKSTWTGVWLPIPYLLFKEF